MLDQETLTLDGDAATPSAGALEFFVLGKPQTAGSKTALPITKGGQRVGTRVVESGNRAAKQTWRGDCRDAASKVIGDAEGWPFEGACEVVAAVFYFARPKSHYGTGRNERELKSSAPRHHLQDPDASKVWRAVEDALTGVVWTDDNRVVAQAVRKEWADRFTGREGVLVAVRRL